MSDNNVSNNDVPSAPVETINRGKTYKAFYVYASILNVTLGSLFFGYVMSAFNPIQEFVKPHGFSKPIEKILVTLMTSFVPLGAGIGALSAGKLASSFGRRKSIMYIDIISIISTVLTLIPSVYSLLVGRLIQGYCVGANSSLVPLYITEIAPTEITGRLGTLNQLLITVGILIAPLVGLGMPNGTGDDQPDNQFFRVELGLAGIPPIVRFILTLLIFRSETPKYLLNKNNERGALALLKKLYVTPRAEEEFGIVKKQIELQSQAGKVTLKQIFSLRYRKRLFVGVMVCLLQQLSGVNAIIFFSNSIFSVGADKGTKNPTIYTIVFAIIQVAATLVAGLIIERVGRRLMLISGMLFSGLVLAAFGILGVIDPDSAGGKFLIWAYILGFGLSLGPLPWVYISDILPDIGIGIASLVNWIAVFVIGLVFPSVSDNGMGWAFIFFAVCSLLGFVFMLFYVKETGDKTEEQIAAMFGYKGDASEPGRIDNVGIVPSMKSSAVTIAKQDSEADTIKGSPTQDDLDKVNHHLPIIPTISTQVDIAVQA